MLAHRLTDDAGCADYAPPRLVLSAARPLPADFARTLTKALHAATGSAWDVSLTNASAETLRARSEREAAERKASILSDPASAAVLAAFPDAQLIDPSTRTAA
jgi:DNA polymerase-3 subunit gamma/tau